MNVLNMFPKLIKQTMIFSGLAMVVLLQGCFHSDDNPPAPIPDAVPTGYYNTGSLSVDGGAITDSSMQAMISGNRIMMLSMTHGLLYDGTMTITGNDFTADVTVYTNGKDPISATMTGTITEGSQITGGTLTGSGVGSGTFSLTYADSNNQLADVARVDNDGANASWAYDIYNVSAFSGLDFTVAQPTTLSDNSNPPAEGTFNACVISNGSISPVSDTAIYSISLDFGSCVDFPQVNTANTGTYTGMSVSQTVADTTLVVAFSNGTYAIIGEFQ